MKHKLFLFVILSFLFSSCGQSIQYDLIISNTSSKTIQIAFKSQYTGYTKEKIVTISPNQKKQILSTKNISKEEITSPKNPCNVIAEYVKITTKKGQASNYQWCSLSKSTSYNDFKLIKADFEQEEYVVTINDTHFD